MGLGLVFTALAAMGAAGDAGADAVADAPAWTVSLTGGYSSLTDTDPKLDSTSGGVGLSWTSGRVTVGGSVSALNGSSLPPEFATAEDGKGATVSGFVGWGVGDFDLDLSASYARQTQDGVGRISDDGPAALRGRDVNVDGETNSSSVSFGVGRTFAFETTWLTPHARVSWERVDGETSATLVSGTGSGLQSTTDASGGSLALGVEAGADLASWLSVFADVTGVASSNEAANVFGLGGRVSRPVSSEDADEGASWAALSAGFTIYAPADISIGLVAGASAGREDDDAFASMTLSKSF